MSKKKKKNRVKTLWAAMYVLMIIGISLIISAFAIVTINDVFALVSDNERSVTLVFSEEKTTVKEAAEALQDSGMIPSEFLTDLWQRQMQQLLTLQTLG